VKFLVTLEDYTINKEFKVARILKKLFKSSKIDVEVNVDYEKPIRRLILSSEGDMDKILNVLRLMPEVSRIIPIFFEQLPYDLNLVKLKSLEAISYLKNRYGSGTFKVEVKKLSDEFKVSSLGICRDVGSYVKENLGLNVDVKNPDFILYIQFGRSGVLIGATLNRFYRKLRRTIPLNFFSDFIIIFENPKTTYEIMDMLRLCASLNVELRIVGGRRDKIERALENVGGVARGVKLKLFSNIDEALEDVYPIGFSFSGVFNECDLISIIKGNLGVKFGFLIGNEYEGLSIEARHKVKYLIRLGPPSTFSMRSSTAAAYILGLIAGLLMKS